MENKKESILHPAARPKGGAYLPHLKATSECETVIMPVPKEVKIPMQQHIGAPAKPTVKAGDTVFVGTLIGEAQGFVSANVHSSVSGTVKSIAVENGTEYVTVETDGEQKCDPDLKPFPIESAEDIPKAADACGLVGLGGAGFPAKVKLTVNKNTPIDTLIINAAECEPYITSDYRECIEKYEDVIDGVYFLKEKLNIPKVIICVESNKKRAIQKLYQIASDRRDADDTVKLMKLPTRYPQGAEKVIIYSATGRKVPLGKLPSDVGCIVMNITSIATLYRFIKTGMPLVSKRITVDGTAVAEPKNILVPIGAKVSEVLDFAGQTAEDADTVIMGGPMMGNAIFSTDSVIEKRTNAVTVMRPAKKKPQTACIRCGRCAAACPMQLYPAAVESNINAGKYGELKNLNIMYCMECGSCSYVCPASRPLTQIMRLAKAEIKKEGKK